MPLSREEILGLADREIREVAVPQWNGTVYLRSLSAGEREMWEAGELEIQKNASEFQRRVHQRARLLALCLCDAAGNQIFGATDVLALSGRNDLAIDSLAEIAMRMNGIGQKAADEAAKSAAGAAAEALPVPPGKSPG